MMYLKRIIALAVACPICAGLGGVVGWFVGSYYKPAEVFIGTYEQDLTAYNNFKQFLNDNNYKEDELESIDFSSSEILNKISIGDIAGYAQYKYCNMNEYTSYVACSKAVSGSLNNQTVISEYIQNGKLRSRENVCTSSSGLVAFGEIAYNFDSTKPITSSTQAYVGRYDYYRCPSKVSFDEENYVCSAEYDQGKRTWSAERMIQTVSFVPEFPFGYNINNETLKDATRNTKDYKKRDVSFNNTVDIVDGNYVFYLNLNTKATETLALYSANSTRDQNDLAAMEKPPEYKNCGVMLTTTKDLKIVNLKSCEDYKVYTKLAAAGTLGYCNVAFSYEKKELHSVNTTTINYFLAEEGL